MKPEISGVACSSDFLGHVISKRLGNFVIPVRMALVVNKLASEGSKMH